MNRQDQIIFVTSIVCIMLSIAMLFNTASIRRLERIVNELQKAQQQP